MFNPNPDYDPRPFTAAASVKRSTSGVASRGDALAPASTATAGMS